MLPKSFRVMQLANERSRVQTWSCLQSSGVLSSDSLAASSELHWVHFSSLDLIQSYANVIADLVCEQEVGFALSKVWVARGRQNLVALSWATGDRKGRLRVLDKGGNFLAVDGWRKSYVEGVAKDA